MRILLYLTGPLVSIFVTRWAGLQGGTRMLVGAVLMFAIIVPGHLLLARREKGRRVGHNDGTF
jgi:hypothetical protein